MGFIANIKYYLFSAAYIFATKKQMFTLLDQPNTETRNPLPKNTEAPVKTIHIHLSRSYLCWWAFIGFALLFSILDQFLFFKEIVTCGVILIAAQIMQGHKNAPRKTLPNNARPN